MKIHLVLTLSAALTAFATHRPSSMKRLVEEDSVCLRETLARAISRMVHAVDVAVDAAVHTMMGAAGDYDAIVLDRMLPCKHGPEGLTGWRGKGRRTPRRDYVSCRGGVAGAHGCRLIRGCGADDLRPIWHSFLRDRS